MEKIKRFTLRYKWHGIITFILIGAIAFHFEDVQTEDNSVISRNYALIIGGLIGLYLAIRRTIVTDKQHDLVERGQITDRYSKAVEQLGDRENVSVRIDGLYALQRIAKDSEDDLPTIQNVIANFIRRPPYEDISNKGEAKDTPKPRDCPDLHIAVEIFQDLKNDTFTTPTLMRSKLPYFDLLGLDLNHLTFRGSKFEGSHLYGVNLSNSDCSFCNFNQTNLSKALAIKSNFTYATIQSSDLNYSNFSESQMLGSDISNSTLKLSLLNECNLACTNFSQSNIDLTTLKNSNLTSATFTRVKNLYQETLNTAWAWETNDISLPDNLSVPRCPMRFAYDSIIIDHSTPPTEWNKKETLD